MSVGHVFIAEEPRSGQVDQYEGSRPSDLLDTSEMLVDRSVLPQMGRFRPTGVCPQLVWNVRRALDDHGHRGVKIVVSGGFSVEKIQEFQRQGVPVDGYGVGSSLFQGRFDFTADVVLRDGRPCAKVGRELRPNPRLERVG